VLATHVSVPIPISQVIEAVRRVDVSSGRAGMVAIRARCDEQRVKEFETRESKFVRRKLLQEIDKVLEASESFTLSAATGKKRLIVHVFSGLLMLLGLPSGSLLLHHLLGAANVDWKTLVPLAASSATLVTTFIYYLKWNDDGFENTRTQNLKRDDIERTFFARLGWRNWRPSGRPMRVASCHRN
jgi:hypothetical protein